jgi:hypothetical protein
MSAALYQAELLTLIDFGVFIAAIKDFVGSEEPEFRSFFYWRVHGALQWPVHVRR